MPQDAGDLIDFSAIETQKENIQAVPGGRSAKSLASLCPPLAAQKSPPLSETQNLKDSMRVEFEKELEVSGEADDPLDTYDRYVKWTMDAYPSAQSTTESRLLPLLERATKAFLMSDHYKNDPRYLKLWLLYIKLFSDSPRETYAFLSKHNVGENLALFYEEFAAWLEAAGRWVQAEEVYLSGIDREARPQERLIRKFGEFQHRRETKTSQTDGPTSPAMPKIRPALAAKLDPFASTAEETDPQARDRAAAAAATSGRAPKAGRAKMSIFADGDEPQKPGSSDSNSGWDSIGSLKERRKENTREAQSWAGETLQGGRRVVSGPKMMVFKDQSLLAQSNDGNANPPSQSSLQYSVNLKTGRKEYVFANLELVYPSGDAESGYEFCFEELRAMKRGLIDPTGRRIAPVASKRKMVERPTTPPDKIISPKNTKAHSSKKLDIFQDTTATKVPTKIPIFDDSEAPPVQQDTAARIARKARKEEKANRTRKLVVMEVKAEPQIVQANLNSPAGPKLKRKKSAEPTMTLHTKAAMNEVYDLFNQTLTKVEEEAPEETDSQIDSDEDDDDDYTSAGESTTTGRFSAATSEYEDDTRADLTTNTSADASNDFTSDSRTDLVGEEDATNASGWSEFTEVKALPGLQDGAEDDERDDDDEYSDGGTGDFNAHAADEDETQTEQSHINDELATPTSPIAPALEDHDLIAFEPEQMERPALNQQGFSYRSRQLPFMTPIVEKTESSIGAMTVLAEKDYFNAKTPSRQNNAQTPRIPEDCETEVWSSPFQGALQEDKENAMIPPLDLPKAVTASKPKPLSLVKASTQDAKANRNGPIIDELLCDPVEEATRQKILAEVQPPLSSYNGYFDRRGKISGKGVEIRKFTKALKNKDSKAGEHPKLALEGVSRQYTVRKELGKGAFAPVYLVDSHLPIACDENDENRPIRMGEGDFGTRRAEQEAIKMEEPPSAWEFYIIRQAKRRLGVSRPSESIINAHEMHLYDDECFLVEEYRSQGTLLDLVNICRAEGTAMDEQLVMFFTIELFRTVEALHNKGVIHGDLKADNILLRLDASTSDADWSSQYRRSGTNGWSDKGITIIDFGRGIDLKAFRPDVQFIAEWKTSEGDCAEMREGRPWTYQVDYHGLAGTIHSMLFGKYLEIVAERGAPLGAGATKTYKVRETLKRYWQTELWGRVFNLLLNPLSHLDGEEGNKMPVLSGLKMLREEMETFLEGNGEKGTGVKAGLRRIEGVIKERRK